MSLETYKVLVCTTGHIKKADCSTLDSESEFPVFKNEYGYLIIIPDSRMNLTGYSADFVNLVVFCGGCDFKYLHLDRDAAPIPGLNINDW